ncbi:NAD-dependent epimerase/dehydratase family protein [Paenibacillus sp. H1-7]|uniref:NAD-dependent epimerase/dehydratase family protein n=1 Tax=Paenibacillus sp. H1-7 TaxID=2282849 RepID=UPI001EF7A8BD|nr:NAD-dependent epimerase/dehydratase family protein [Paenibacillus sp. H1-7]ULL14263.1 NAD-dependent epimerase/dehydratase family protein [Paenibacillus sp. H1-7]
MKLLVLGGTGVISRAIVAEALARQHEVAVFNRGSKNHLFSGEVECIVGDKANREQFREVMKDRQFDAVIDMISFDAKDAQSTVETFQGRSGQIIVCSSTAAYKRPFRTVPTSEDAEQLVEDAAFPYAFHKAEMERYLQQVIEAGELPVTIIRPSLTYGIGAANLGVLRQNYNIVHRIRSRKPLVMFGDGTIPWSFSFAPDVAKAFVGAAGNERMYGQHYHATNEDIHVWQDLYLEFGKLLGIEPELVHISSSMLKEANPDLFAHLYYEKSYSGLFDNSKLKLDLPGYQASISLSSGLAMMLEWYEREGHSVDESKDRLEDRLTAFYTDACSQLKGLF